MQLLKKSKHIPTLLTFSYSITSAYSLASLSNKYEYQRTTDKLLFNFSVLCGGLFGFYTSILIQISFGYNFLHVTLGMLTSGAIYASNTNRNKIEEIETKN